MSAGPAAPREDVTGRGATEAPPGRGAQAEPALRAFLRRAPKTEVHVHLEGALAAPFLDRLARRHGLAWAGRTHAELAPRLRFGSAAEFFRTFRWVVEEHLRTPADYADALREAARALGADGVREAELSVSAGALLFFARPLGEILAALDEAAAEVERTGGPELRFVADGVRRHGPDPLARVVDLLRPLPRGRWPALGLAGAEAAMPARVFADVFVEARRAGLRADVHAGEEEGPRAVWEALEHLGADRLIHALGAAGDPALVRHLRDRRVPLALNPTSNARLGLVASIAEHPLARWLRAGLLVSVNTDDPALLGTTLSGELHTIADVAGLGQVELEALLLGGLECAFLSEGVRGRRLQERGLVLERLREELGLHERVVGAPPRVVTVPATE